MTRDYAGRQQRIFGQEFTGRGSEIGVLGEALHQNLPRAVEDGAGISEAAVSIDVGTGGLLGVE